MQQRKKITSPPNEWHNIPFKSKKLSGSNQGEPNI